jgi:hypothetical protein
METLSLKLVLVVVVLVLLLLLLSLSLSSLHQAVMSGKLLSLRRIAFVALYKGENSKLVAPPAAAQRALEQAIMLGSVRSLFKALVAGRIAVVAAVTAALSMISRMFLCNAFLYRQCAMTMMRLRMRCR